MSSSSSPPWHRYLCRCCYSYTVLRRDVNHPPTLMHLSCVKTSTATSFGSCNSPMTSSSQYTPNRLATIVFTTKSFEYSRRRGRVVVVDVVRRRFAIRRRIRRRRFRLVGGRFASRLFSHRVGRALVVAAVIARTFSSSVLFVPPNGHNSTKRQRSILPPRLVRMLQYHDATIAH